MTSPSLTGHSPATAAAPFSVTPLRPRLVIHHWPAVTMNLACTREMVGSAGSTSSDVPPLPGASPRNPGFPPQRRWSPAAVAEIVATPRRTAFSRSVARARPGACELPPRVPVVCAEGCPAGADRWAGAHRLSLPCPVAPGGHHGIPEDPHLDRVIAAEARALAGDVARINLSRARIDQVQVHHAGQRSKIIRIHAQLNGVRREQRSAGGHQEQLWQVAQAPLEHVPAVRARAARPAAAPTDGHRRCRGTAVPARRHRRARRPA